MDDHFARVLDADADAPTGNKRPRDDRESSSTASHAKRKPAAAAALSKRELDALVDSASAQDMDQLDARALKSMAATLEKLVRKNALLRSKHADAPEKFMDSELALDTELARWKQLAAAPVAVFAQLVTLDVAPLLLGLFAHENVDIRLDVVALLADLTDVDSAEAEAGALDARRALATELLKHKLLPLLVTHIEQLDALASGSNGSDSDDEATAGVYNALQILENLAELAPATCATVCTTTRVLPVLLAHVASARVFSQNKLYASELLSILLQSGPQAQRALLDANAGTDTDEVKTKVGATKHRNLLDELLRAIAPFRKREPASEEEHELLENLVNALCSALLLPSVQHHFRHLEGLELALRCLQDRTQSVFGGALRIVDHALMGNARNCERLVQIGGLRTIFAVFMGRKSKHQAQQHKSKPKRSSAAADKAKEEENVASILASLCALLTPAARDDALDRFHAKFVERDHEKLDRVVDLFVKYLGRVEQHDLVQADDDDEGDDDDEDERYLQRLDAGLFTLQRITHVVAHLCANSRKHRAYVIVKLHAHRIELDVLARILEEQLAMLAPPPPSDGDAAAVATPVKTEANATASESESENEKVEAQRALLLHLLRTLQTPDAAEPAESEAAATGNGSVDKQDDASVTDAGANERPEQ